MRVKSAIRDLNHLGMVIIEMLKGKKKPSVKQ
jgi:hypothetical protein